MKELYLTQLSLALYAKDMQNNPETVESQQYAPIEDILKTVQDDALREKTKATLEKLKSGKKLTLIEIIKEWFQWLFTRDAYEKQSEAEKNKKTQEYEISRRMQEILAKKAYTTAPSNQVAEKTAALNDLPNKAITFLPEADLKPEVRKALAAEWQEIRDAAPSGEKNQYNVEVLAEMGAKPPPREAITLIRHRKGEFEQMRQKYKESGDDDEKRRSDALELLGRLEPGQEDAIIEAHHIGDNEPGTDGKKPAHVGTYTKHQLGKKMRILQDAGLSEVQIRKLMWAGITGIGDVGPEEDTEGRSAGLDRGNDVEFAKAAWSKWLIDHPNAPDEQKQDAEYLASRGYLPEDWNLPHQGSGKRGRSVLYTLADHEERSQERKVNNIFNLCDEIMRYSDPKWGLNGSHPLLRPRVDKTGNQMKYTVESRKAKNVPKRKRVKNEDGSDAFDEITGQPLWETVSEPETEEGTSEVLLWELDQANFISWFRDRLVFFHNDSPDEVFSLLQKVRLQREFRDISIGEMLENQERYFRDDANNIQYKELADQIRRELWMFTNSRNHDIEYKLVMGAESEMPKTLQKIMYQNVMTKMAWQKSVLNWILTMPKYFESRPDILNAPPGSGLAKDRQPTLDTALGAAVNAAYLAYYNISDYDKLKDILGDDADILSPKRIRAKIIRSAKNDPYATFIPSLSKERMDSIFDKVKDADERGDKDAAEAFLDELIEQAPLDEIGKFVDKKTYSNLEYVNSDTGVHEGLIEFINVFNKNQKQTRQINVIRELMRDSIANKYGARRYTVDEHGNRVQKDWEELDETERMYAENWAFTMVRWSGAGARNDLNAQAYDSWTKIQLTRPYRFKQSSSRRGGGIGNPYTVFSLKGLGRDFMTGVRTEAENKRVSKGPGNEDEVFYKNPLQIMEELFEASKRGEQVDFHKFHDIADQLVFPENTQREFALNHIGRGMEIFQQIMSGQEINLDKFTSFESINGGIKFDRAQFIEAVQEKMIKPLRYMYSTWDQINLAAPVRWYNDQTGKYEDVSIAEAMLGHQLLDIPEFRGKDGKIDPDKINMNKAQFFKQVLLARISADMYAHRDFHSTDPAYDMGYYLHIVEALEKIPGTMIGSEYDQKSTLLKGHFFSHNDIHFLRELSASSNGELYRMQIRRDLFKAAGPMMGEMFKIFFQAVGMSGGK